MNRLRITQAAKDFLTEYKGDSSAETPFVWPALVTQAANDVAHRTGCFYGTTSRPVASGVSDYPQLSVYAIRRVTVGDGSGNTILLNPMTMDDLNIWGAVQGFTTASGGYTAGIPSNYVRLASNLIRILPVPNYTGTNLSIEGLAFPSESWPADVAECPLPVEAHMAVVYRAAVLRSMQFPDPDNKARVDAMAAVYETEIGAAKEMMSATSAVQAQMDTSAPYSGGV
jgi:hypothetical protein